MPVWLQVASIVFGIIGTLFGIFGSIFGISAYSNERMKHKAELKNHQEDVEREKLEKMEKEQYLKDLRDIIREENTPLREDIAEIKHCLTLNTKGTVTMLRMDMKESLESLSDKGFASSSDIANWKELYNVYKELGGNHFAEYVDAWKKEVEDLPPKKKTKRRLAEKK